MSLWKEEDGGACWEGARSLELEKPGFKPRLHTNDTNGRSLDKSFRAPASFSHVRWVTLRLPGRWRWAPGGHARDVLRQCQAHSSCPTACWLSFPLGWLRKVAGSIAPEAGPERRHNRVVGAGILVGLDGGPSRAQDLTGTCAPPSEDGATSGAPNLERSLQVAASVAAVAPAWEQLPLALRPIAVASGAQRGLSMKKGQDRLSKHPLMHWGASHGRQAEANLTATAGRCTSTTPMRWVLQTYYKQITFLILMWLLAICPQIFAFRGKIIA